MKAVERHYRISELAQLLHVSRGTAYNLLRGEFVIDFAAPGRRGVKLVPESTVQRILEKRRRQFR
jgi:hypothetical protein